MKLVNTNQPRYLTTQQAADYLCLKSTTLHQWRWAGKGPKFTRLGTRTIRYTYQDLQDWIENSNRI